MSFSNKTSLFHVREREKKPLADTDLLYLTNYFTS